MKKIIYLDFNAFLTNPQIVLLGEKEITRIKKAKIDLIEGVEVTFFDDDKDEFDKSNYICADAILEFDKNENVWLVKFKLDSDYYLEVSDNVVAYR